MHRVLGVVLNQQVAVNGVVQVAAGSAAESPLRAASPPVIAVTVLLPLLR